MAKIIPINGRKKHPEEHYPAEEPVEENFFQRFLRLFREGSDQMLMQGVYDEFEDHDDY